MPKQISVEGDGHCCHRPSSNWETNQLVCLFVCLNLLMYLPASVLHLASVSLNGFLSHAVHLALDVCSFSLLYLHITYFMHMTVYDPLCLVTSLSVSLWANEEGDANTLCYHTLTGVDLSKILGKPKFVGGNMVGLKTDKCKGVSRFGGARPGCPPQSLLLCSPCC